MRYAKGFIHTAEAISVSQSMRSATSSSAYGAYEDIIRSGKETLLSPAEQQQVIAIARNLGLQRTEYFDAYVEEYNFT